MKAYLIYIVLIYAWLSVNAAGMRAQENKGRDPFRLPVEIEMELEKNSAPAAVKPEVKEDVKENLDDSANAMAAEEQAKQQEKEAREEQEREEEQKRQEEIALALKIDEEEISRITLSGIVFSEGRRTAILDRKILREGDTIGVRKIIGIEKNKVILLSNGKKYTIELKGENR